MDKSKYLNEMRALLSFMSDADRAKVLRHYERMFEDAGEEGERDVIRLLGSPVRQVLQVERDYREREEQGLTGVSAIYEEPEPTAAAVQEPAEQPTETREEISEFPPYAETVSASEENIEAAEGDSYAADALRAAFAAFSAEQKEDDCDAAEIPEIEEGNEGEKAGAGRVTLAVVLSPLIVILALLGIALTLAVSVIGLVPGAAFGVGSVYFIGYAVLGMSYIPDMLMVLGVGVACFGAAILLLWFGIWILLEGISLVIRLISRIYNGILRKRGAKA